MLNQLKNEVKKYPLNNKKNISANLSNNIDNERRNNENKPKAQKSSLIKNSNINKEITSNNTTVSFNNSKDFSIYNNLNTGIKNEQQENNLLNVNKTNGESSPSSFKDRLNQIDLR
tara:strand:+ start:145 stop:492 length:348 start_codon:yes stop_codon:yes gene_type:complete